MGRKDDRAETPDRDDDMKTKLTVLAALLFAGASQAALAQDHDHDRGDRPQAAGQPGGGGGGGHWNGGGGERRGGAPGPAPQAAPAPQPQPGGGEHRWNGGGDRARFQPQPGAPAAAPAPQAQPRNERDGGHDWGRDRRDFAPGGTANGDRRWDRRDFAPGGAANGDRRWDRRDVPREVIPPGPNVERGWDREHDGHAPANGAWDRDRRDGDRRWSGDDRRWDRDGHRDGDRRGPPANWRHWERGRVPPIYAAPHRFHVGRYAAPYGWYVRNWAFGDILPRGWFAPDYWVGDFWDYDLPYPPPGAHWVRVGDDALLVDDYSGRIMQVVRDIFW